MSDPTWHCNACGESGEGDLFEQCWTMPLVDHGWPNSRHHWPTGKPASFTQATFFCAMRDLAAPLDVLPSVEALALALHEAMEHHDPGPRPHDHPIADSLLETADRIRARLSEGPDR